MIQSELKKRNLPDLLKLPNGDKISSKKEWEEIMRPFWKRMLLNEEYGEIPPFVQPEITARKNHITFGGKATWEDIFFKFSYNGKECTVPTKLILPNKEKDFPVFISLNFLSEEQNRYLPTEEILDGGCGVFCVAYKEISSDNGDFTNGLANLFFGDNERQGKDCGKIMLWSYMASRMMDYLLKREDINHKKIGVIGHSRLGKTALLTAAIDERFAFACVNESGTSGAALVRGATPKSESVEYICHTFPFWFCPNYQKYGKGEAQLPFDQHALISLIAPRAVFVGAAVEDEWADTNNQFLSCAAASEVWGLYGKQGFIYEDRLPEIGDVFTSGEVGFHLREGSHYQSRFDWKVYMQAVRDYFKN